MCFFIATPNPHFQPSRQSIHHGHTNPVQSARHFICAITFIIELTPGVQFTHNQFQRTATCFMINIKRHTTAIITYCCTAIGIQRNIYRIGITGHSLVYGIINNFVNHMVQTRTALAHVTDIHSGAFFNRFQSL